MDETVRKACAVLDVRIGDPAAVIKRKYRMLIRKYHPDQQPNTGAEAEKAVRMVTEAYAILCRYLKETEPETDSRLTVNPAAYCSRIVYTWHDLFEEDGIVERAYGPYFWDPDEEEFLLYLRSIRKAAERILAERAGRPDETLKIRLFHLLAQEFIRPLYCLKRTETVTEEDPVRRLFLTQGRIREEDSGHIGAAAPLACKLNGTRIEALLPDGVRTPVSFEEDSLYYVLSMLLARDAAAVTAFAAGPDASRGRLRILIEITDAEKAAEPGRSGGYIRKLLERN